MENLNQILQKTFNVSIAETFSKNAIYNPAMDCAEYVSSDEVVLAVRVDEFLTLYKDRYRAKVIGFKCKGFRYLFEQAIKNGAELDENDFVPLVKVIEYALTHIGNQVIDPGKEEAYRQAQDIAERDNV
jgi:hypothetical protein